MGNMLHVVKKQREYGKSKAFKYGFGEFKDLLSSLGCEVYDLDDYSSSDFEIPCEEYERAMTILARIIEAQKKDKDMDLNDINFSDLKSGDDDPDWCFFDPDNYDFNDVKDDLKKLNDYSIDEILKIIFCCGRCFSFRLLLRWRIIGFGCGVVVYGLSRLGVGILLVGCGLFVFLILTLIAFFLPRPVVFKCQHSGFSCRLTGLLTSELLGVNVRLFRRICFGRVEIVLRLSIIVFFVWLIIRLRFVANIGVIRLFGQAVGRLMELLRGSFAASSSDASLNISFGKGVFCVLRALRSKRIAFSSSRCLTCSSSCCASAAVPITCGSFFRWRSATLSGCLAIRTRFFFCEASTLACTPSACISACLSIMA